MTSFLFMTDNSKSKHLKLLLRIVLIGGSFDRHKIKRLKSAFTSKSRIGDNRADKSCLLPTVLKSMQTRINHPQTDLL